MVKAVVVREKSPFDKTLLSAVEGLSADGDLVESVTYPFVPSLSKHERINLRGSHKLPTKPNLRVWGRCYN